jgi:hypothetical protein
LNSETDGSDNKSDRNTEFPPRGQFAARSATCQVCMPFLTLPWTSATSSKESSYVGNSQCRTAREPTAPASFDATPRHPHIAFRFELACHRAFQFACLFAFAFAFQFKGFPLALLSGLKLIERI